MGIIRYPFVAESVAVLCSSAILLGLSACAGSSPAPSATTPTSSESAQPDSSADPQDSGSASESLVLCSEEQLLTMAGLHGDPPTDVSPTFEPAEMLAGLPVVCVASSVSATGGPESLAVLEGGQATIDALAVKLEALGMPSNLNESISGDDQRGAQVLPFSAATDATEGFDDVNDLVWVEIGKRLG